MSSRQTKVDGSGMRITLSDMVDTIQLLGSLLRDSVERVYRQKDTNLLVQFIDPIVGTVMGRKSHSRSDSVSPVTGTWVKTPSWCNQEGFTS